MTELNRGIRNYVRMQKALGHAQGERRILRFIDKGDLNEKSDEQDRWLAKLTAHYKQNIEDKIKREEIRDLMYKLENLEPLESDDIQRLKGYLEKPLDA